MLRRLLGMWRRVFDLSGFATVLSVLLVLSVSLNLVLAQRLRAATAPRASATSRALKVGQVVGTLAGETRRGASPALHAVLQAQRYDPRGDRGTLLYFSSAKCKWSQQNLATFTDLARRVRDHYRVVAVDMTPGLKNEPSHLDDVPDALVLRNLSSDSLQTYRISGTPETIVISPQSKIDRVWVGAYGPQNAAEVSQYFHVVLTPVVRPQPVAQLR
jgi:hypothetical protein